jgi:hypothetical protein
LDDEELSIPVLELFEDCELLLLSIEDEEELSVPVPELLDSSPPEGELLPELGEPFEYDESPLSLLPSSLQALNVNAMASARVAANRDG